MLVEIGMRHLDLARYWPVFALSGPALASGCSVSSPSEEVSRSQSPKSTAAEDSKHEAEDAGSQDTTTTSADAELTDTDSLVSLSTRETSVSTSTQCERNADLSVVRTGPAPTLPTVLTGTLCDSEDAIWLVVEPGLGTPVRARLQDTSRSYTLSVFQAEEGEFVPLRSRLATHVFALDANTPELVVFHHNAVQGESQVALKLEGPAGAAEVLLEGVALAPFIVCTGQYESVPIDGLPAPLPAVFEVEICSGRDSRVRAFEVTAGRTVVVTLENPEAIEYVDVDVVLADAAYELLPVTTGSNTGILGLLAQDSMSFVPQTNGSAALYVAGAVSRGEPMRFSVEQR